MKAITVSRTLNVILLVLLVVAAITTKTAYAACKTDLGGGNLCGNAWLSYNAAGNSDQAWGNGSRNPAPYLTTVYVEGWTNCGGTTHRIGAAQNQIINSNNVTSANAGSGPRSCIDSAHWTNESRVWAHAHNSSGGHLGTQYSLALNNY